MDPQSKTAEVKPVTATSTTTTQTMQKKGNKTLMIVIIILILLCLCVSGVIGVIYYLSTRAASDLATQAANAAAALNQSSGNSSGTDGTNGSNGSDGSSSGTGVGVNVSGGASLPSDFPTDVPVFPNANITGSTTTNGETDVLMTASASPADVYSYYKTNLASNGWTVTSDTNLGTAYGIDATKDGKTVQVGIADYTTDASNPSTFVTLDYK